MHVSRTTATHLHNQAGFLYQANRGSPLLWAFHFRSSKVMQARLPTFCEAQQRGSALESCCETAG